MRERDLQAGHILTVALFNEPMQVGEDALDWRTFSGAGRRPRSDQRDPDVVDEFLK